MIVEVPKILIGGNTIIRRCSLVIVCLLLAVCSSLQMCHNVNPQTTTIAREAKLGLLPSTIIGWKSQELPLGLTEQDARTAESVLNLEKHVYREFRKDKYIITLYAAYWGYGRMPTQLVALHTPDRCWTENGWNCIEMRFNERITAGVNTLKPAQWRRFTSQYPSHNGQYVLYWHLVGGKIYNYGERFNMVPSVWLWWRDATLNLINQSPEQYFIRLTSNHPFGDYSDEKGWNEIIMSLASIGLVEGN